MRVTEQLRLNNQVSYLNAASERMDRIQRQLATGKRIDKASDDPSGTALALAHRKNLAFETQMRRNMENGTAFLNVTESALDGATDLLQRARELTIRAANGTNGPEELRSIGAEVGQLVQGLAQIANSNFGGAYIFGGHQTQAPAYQVTGSPPTAITYQGDTGQRVHRISAQDTVPTNVVGSSAFGTIFNELIALRDNLNTNGPLSVTSAAIANIDSGLDRVLQARADVGARLNRFESAQRRSEDTDVSLQELRAQIEDVDLADAIIRMTAQQNALQAALGAIGRTANDSLLNFLR
ncbi:MAG: flagellar hook-associated protein 3, partial [Anaerolinea sp.]|nr:flagellar hook-associated protein 3 [Anaerolinea sp.]